MRAPEPPASKHWLILFDRDHSSLDQTVLTLGWVLDHDLLHPATARVSSRWLLRRENIRAVADIEHEYLAQRSHEERLGDTVARFAGSATFFVLNVVWYLAWILLNARIIPGLHPFDPYPFTFLTLMVSLEAIFLAIFVLASQNRMSRLADHCKRSQTAWG